MPSTTTTTTTTDTDDNATNNNMSGGSNNNQGGGNNSSSIMKRGYSMLQLNHACRVTGTSIETNVLIKKNVPARGLVSSNPLRIERLLKRCTDAGLLNDVQLHTDSGWGIKIWTCMFAGCAIFIAVTPMGSTGGGMCFWELYAAQAQAILRFGANDQTDDPHGEVVICHQADNLVNLPHAAGDLDVTRQTVFAASKVLVDSLKKHFESNGQHQHRVVSLPVHHVEDYHAYNLSECLPDEGRHITEFIGRLKRKSPNGCCWDMESAALFYRAQQYGLHAATVLIPMTVEGAELSHYRLLFQTLVDFSPLVAPEVGPVTSHSTAAAAAVAARSNRRFSTNDVIGTDDKLFFVNDPELGNNLFADEPLLSEGGDGGGITTDDGIGSDVGGIVF